MLHVSFKNLPSVLNSDRWSVVVPTVPDYYVDGTAFDCTECNAGFSYHIKLLNEMNHDNRINCRY